MIDNAQVKELQGGTQPGVIGTLTIGGSPGRYTLRRGLNGPTIAEGAPEEILGALGEILLQEWVAAAIK